MFLRDSGHPDRGSYLTLHYDWCSYAQNGIHVCQEAAGGRILHLASRHPSFISPLSSASFSIFHQLVQISHNGLMAGRSSRCALRKNPHLPHQDRNICLLATASRSQAGDAADDRRMTRQTPARHCNDATGEKWTKAPECWNLMGAHWGWILLSKMHVTSINNAMLVNISGTGKYEENSWWVNAELWKNEETTWNWSVSLDLFGMGLSKMLIFYVINVW